MSSPRDTSSRNGAADGQPFWRTASFAGYLGFTCALVMFRGPTSFFPMYLTDRQFPIAEIGWIMGAAGIGAVAAQPFSAHITQHAYRLALTLGVVLYAGSVGYLASPGLTSGFMFGAMLLQGASAAICTNCIHTLLVEATPKAQRSHGIALYWAAFQASSLAGPALAELLIRWRSYSEAALWFAWGLGSVTVIGGLLIRRHPAEPPSPSDRRSPVRGFLRQTTRPAALVLAMTFFLVSVAWWAQGDLLTGFARSRGIDHVTPFFVTYFLVMFPTRLLLSHVPDRLGRALVAAASMLVYAAFFVALIFARSSASLAMLGILAGASNCLSWPALYAIFYDRISVTAYATAFGAFLLSAARWVAGWFFGRVGASFGYEGVFLMAALLCLLSSILLFLAHPASAAAAEGHVG